MIQFNCDPLLSIKSNWQRSIEWHFPDHERLFSFTTLCAESNILKVFTSKRSCTITAWLALSVGAVSLFTPFTKSTLLLLSLIAQANLRHFKSQESHKLANNNADVHGRESSSWTNHQLRNKSKRRRWRNKIRKDHNWFLLTLICENSSYCRERSSTQLCELQPIAY